MDAPFCLSTHVGTTTEGSQEHLGVPFTIALGCLVVKPPDSFQGLGINQPPPATFLESEMPCTSGVTPWWHLGSSPHPEASCCSSITLPDKPPWPQSLTFWPS